MRALLGMGLLVVFVGTVGALNVYQGSGHYEWIVETTDPAGLAEVRTKSNGPCYGDFITAGTAFSDGTNFLPGETGLIAESTCAGMHHRANADTYIRFSVGLNPIELFQIDRRGLWIGPHPVAESNLTTPGQGWQLYTGADGNLWVIGKNGTKTKLANK